jgi:RimJ/RimL family protein N-acetyltransferase
MSDLLERSIETERLFLRPLVPADAEDLYSIMQDPAIGTFTGDPPPESVDAVRARIEGWKQGPASQSGDRWLNWLARTSEGDAVAHLSATVHGRAAWLAWIVATERQRRGYATEAARGIRDHLEVNGVMTFFASIAEGHAASEGVARNLGMRLTQRTVDGERVWRALT